MRGFTILVLLRLSFQLGSLYAQSSRPRRKRARFSAAVDPLPALLDQDGNGVLSDDELGRAVERLKTLDRNQNGKLDRNELGQNDFRVKLARGSFSTGANRI